MLHSRGMQHPHLGAALVPTNEKQHAHPGAALVLVDEMQHGCAQEDTGLSTSSLGYKIITYSKSPFLLSSIE
jgi:hypothetical protein